jgi:alpha-glucosidase (family GH31 glycosyl hydrolase)
MDKMLIESGIDGWKVDGIDPFLIQLVRPRGYDGPISVRRYADLYYRDFLFQTRKVRGEHALIMSRPVEVWNSIPVIFSPRDVMFSGWVGDQDNTFDGLKVALQSFFHSSWNNYTNFGSDINGYRNVNRGNDKKVVFIRWAQLGAFNSLMVFLLFLLIFSL